MRDEIRKVFDRLNLDRKNKKTWMKIISMLAVCTLIITSYQLSWTGFTISDNEIALSGMPSVIDEAEDSESEGMVLTCGMEEHPVHTADCYITEQVLVCGLEEGGHTHTSDCYETEEVLVCDSDDPEHEHDSSCYEEEEILVCDQEECEGHVHTDECYSVDKILVCETPIHIHTSDCYMFPTEDTESAELASESESTSDSEDSNAASDGTEEFNPVVIEDGAYMGRDATYSQSGVSRENDALEDDEEAEEADVNDETSENVSDENSDDIIGSEADIEDEEVPLAEDSESLSEEKNDEIVSETAESTESAESTEAADSSESSEAAEEAVIRDTDVVSEDAIESTSDSAVENASDGAFVVDPNSTKEAAITAETESAIKSEEPMIMLSSITGSAIDGAVVTIAGNLPEGAIAEITPVHVSTRELEDYVGEEKVEEINDYVAYDIKIFSMGLEWQPDETVAVSVKQPDIEMEKGEKLEAIHVHETEVVAEETTTDEAAAVQTEEVVESLAVAKGEEEVSFSTESFSTFIFFTVDFNYNGQLFSIDGYESITLGALFAAIGIEEDPANVSSCAFSNPELVEVTQIEGDWLLTSLQPFDSLETLTIVMKDGTEFEISVTDDQIHIFDYSQDKSALEIEVSDFYNIVTGRAFWTYTDKTDNAPHGFSYVAYSSGCIEYPYKSGNYYDLYVASQTEKFIINHLGSNSANCLATLTGMKDITGSLADKSDPSNMYAFWIEDSEGKICYFDDVCVGNQGQNDTWSWQFDLGVSGKLFTNDSKIEYHQGKNSEKDTGTTVTYLGTSVYNPYFQGATPNSEGYYFNRNWSTSDEVSVFQIDGDTDDITVKKDVVDDKNPSTKHSGQIQIGWCNEEGQFLEIEDKEHTVPSEAAIWKIEEQELTEDITQGAIFDFSLSDDDCSSGAIEILKIRPCYPNNREGYFKVKEVYAGEDVLYVTPATQEHYYKVVMHTNYPTIYYVGTYPNFGSESDSLGGE